MAYIYDFLFHLNTFYMPTFIFKKSRIIYNSVKEPVLTSYNKYQKLHYSQQRNKLSTVNPTTFMTVGISTHS